MYLLNAASRIVNESSELVLGYAIRASAVSDLTIEGRLSGIYYQTGLCNIHLGDDWAWRKK